MILHDEFEPLTLELHEKLREELTPILMMIHLNGLNCQLAVDRNRSTVNTRQAFLDCIVLNGNYELNETILKIEKEYLDKLFGHFKSIQRSWPMFDFVNNHMSVFLALMFRESKYYINMMYHYVDNIYQSHPHKYEFFVIKGQDLLGWDHNYQTNRELWRKSTHLYNDDYCIKKTKYYIIMENHRYLLKNKEEDLGFYINMTKRGLSNMGQVDAILTGLKKSDIEPIQEMSYAYMSFDDTPIFF